MKAKFVKPLYKPKTDEKETICKVDDIVEFSINAAKKAVLKVGGKDIEVPFKPFFEKVVFTPATKTELVALKLITAEGKLVEAPAANTAGTEEPKKVDGNTAKAATKAEPATKLQLAQASLIGALINLNHICGGELLNLHVTKLTEESVDLSMIFFSTKLPAINATINAADFSTNKLEEEVAAFIEEHSQTITNKLEVLAQLEDQIKSRQAEVAKPAVTAATKGGKKNTTVAKAEKVAPTESSANDFEEEAAEGDGDFETPEEANPVDANEFDE